MPGTINNPLITSKEDLIAKGIVDIIAKACEALRDDEADDDETEGPEDEAVTEKEGVTNSRNEEED